MTRFDRLPGIDGENTTRRNVLIGGAYGFVGISVLGAIGGGSDDEDDEPQGNGDAGNGNAGGDGNGNGNGNGGGDGNGSGNGNGNGNGADDGGNGDADGNGNGDGNGDEGADGTGNGNGDGNGDEGGNGDMVDAPEPQSFSGSGDAVEDGIEIEGGLTVVQAEHTGGEANFAVELVPSEGEYNELFVNKIGEYQGETAALIEADTYQLDITADGDWSVEIAQPRAASGDSLPQTLEDSTNQVMGPFEFNGSHTATGEHSGQENFAVQVFPPTGSFGTLVFNEIGEYEGETTFNFDGVGWVAVQGDGEWTVDLE